MEKELYELLLLITPEATEEEQNQIVSEIEKFMQENAGEILAKQKQEKKKLAYPIKKQVSATYLLIKYKIDPLLIAKFKAKLDSFNKVIRYLITQGEVKPVEKREYTPRIMEKAQPEKAKAEKPTVEEKKPVAKKQKKTTLKDLDKKIDEILSEEII